MILFHAKSDKIFQDPIMAEQLPCCQPGFDFLNVENSDHIYFIKEIIIVIIIKTCSSCIVELNKHAGIFKNTREVRRSTSRRLLKIPACLYNSTMHSACFLFLYKKKNKKKKTNKKKQNKNTKQKNKTKKYH